MRGSYESALSTPLDSNSLSFAVSPVPVDKGLYATETVWDLRFQTHGVDLLWGQGVSGVNRLIDPTVSRS